MNTKSPKTYKNRNNQTKHDIRLPPGGNNKPEA